MCVPLLLGDWNGANTLSTMTSICLKPLHSFSKSDPYKNRLWILHLSRLEYNPCQSGSVHFSFGSWGVIFSHKSSTEREKNNVDWERAADRTIQHRTECMIMLSFLCVTHHGPICRQFDVLSR